MWWVGGGGRIPSRTSQLSELVLVMLISAMGWVFFLIKKTNKKLQKSRSMRQIEVVVEGKITLCYSQIYTFVSDKVHYLILINT